MVPRDAVRIMLLEEGREVAEDLVERADPFYLFRVPVQKRPLLLASLFAACGCLRRVSSLVHWVGGGGGGGVA